MTVPHIFANGVGFLSRQDLDDNFAALGAGTMFAPILASNSGAVNAAAILFAASQLQGAGGGTLILPPGTFPITSIQWDVTLYPKVDIRGSGKGVTILQKSDASSTPVLRIFAAAVFQTFRSYSDFSIFGLAAGSPGLQTDLIGIFTLHRIDCEACSIGWLNNGSLIADVYDCDQRGNVVGYQAQRSGSIYPNLINFYGGQNIANSSIGFDFVYGHGITLRGVDVEGNGVFGNTSTGGIFIRSTATAEIGFGSYAFDSIWFESNHGTPFTCENASNLNLSISNSRVIRNSAVADSVLGFIIGNVATATLTENFAVSGLAGGLTCTTACVSGVIVIGGQYTTFTDASTANCFLNVAANGGLLTLSAAGLGPGTFNFGGFKLQPQAVCPGSGTFTFQVPVAAGAAIGGCYAFIKGTDLATGQSFTRFYLIAIQVGGGAAPAVTAVLLGSSGNATPQFTWDNNGGLLRVNASTTSAGTVTVQGS